MEAEVFGEFGKTVTFISVSSPQYNTRGEIESYTSSSTSITAVPYDIIEDRRNPQPFSELQEGELAMAVKYNQTVTKSDLITMEGITYKISEISKNYLPDNVVTILRLTPTENVAVDDA